MSCTFLLLNFCSFLTIEIIRTDSPGSRNCCLSNKQKNQRRTEDAIYLRIELNVLDKLSCNGFTCRVARIALTWFIYEVKWSKGLNFFKQKTTLGTNHFESNESIEASLLMLPVSEAEATAALPSHVFTEPSPTCVGFHEESWSSHPGDWAWTMFLKFQQGSKSLWNFTCFLKPQFSRKRTL